MESLASVLERYQGELIEVVTNGGQKLSGTVYAAHEDFFTLFAITRLYVVPYTGVSTLLFPPSLEEKLPRQPVALDGEIESPVRASRRKAPEQKESKRTRPGGG